MLYIFTLIIVILGLIKKKSNIVFGMMLVWMWLMLGWSSGNADYIIHLGRFNNYDLISEYTEILYTALMRLANEAGLTYQQFLPLVMLVYVIMIGYIGEKLSEVPAFVLALYFIFPACMEAVQIRYTLAAAFVLLGFFFLFQEEGRDSEVKYICCIIIGALLHVSTIVFILFVIIKWLSIRKTIAYTVVVSGVLYLSRMSMLISLIGRLPGMSEKTGRVLTSAANRYSNITVMKTTFRCVVFFCFFMLLVYYLKEKNNRYKNDLNLQFIENVEKANIVSLVILPLLSYSVDFYRIQQTLTLLNYCALSYFCRILPTAYKTNGNTGIRFVTTKKRLAYTFGCVAMAITNLYYLVLNSNNILTVFRSFFENNLFFGGGYRNLQKKFKYGLLERWVFIRREDGLN